MDTTPIIYFLDDDINYGEKTRHIFETILENEKQLVTSTLTCTEYLVVPYRTNNIEKIDAFFEFVSECGITLHSVNTEIAKKAARIRARYKYFKPMDSLQLASACVQGCDLFLTNDKQLRQFDEITCITLDEWRNSCRRRTKSKENEQNIRKRSRLPIPHLLLFW